MCSGFRSDLAAECARSIVSAFPFLVCSYSLSNAGLRPAGDAVSPLTEQNALLVAYDFSVADPCGRRYVYRFFHAPISAGTVKKQCWFEPAARKILKNI